MTSPQPRPVPEIPEGGSNFRAPDQNFGQAAPGYSRVLQGTGLVVRERTELVLLPLQDDNLQR